MRRYNTGIDRKIIGSVMAALVITMGIVASASYVPSESRSDLRFETSEIWVLNCRVYFPDYGKSTGCFG